MSLQGKMILVDSKKTRPPGDLIIIESPKKIAHLNELLRGINREMRIEATIGRLFDIEPIDPAQFIREGRIQWSPIRPSIVERIVNSINQSSEIFVATDSDVEGEVIAWHIQRLAESSGKTVRRIHIKSLNPEGLTLALSQECPIDFKKAEGGVSRRIFDNFSQFSVDDDTAKRKPYLRGSVGRIITPILSSIVKRPLEDLIVRRSFPIGKTDIYLRAPVSLNNDQILRRMESLPPPVVSGIKTSTEIMTGGLSLSDVMTRFPGALDSKPSEIYASLNELYGEGRVTYFRTDSRRMSPKSAKSLSKKLTDCGIHGKGIAGHPEAGKQDAHEAIMPLSMDSNPFSPISSLNTKDALMSLLWRHYAMVQSGYKIVTENGILSGDAAENQGWLRLQREGVNLSAQRSYAKSTEGRENRAWDSELMPMGIQCFETVNETLAYRRYGAEELIVRRLVEEGLGRPSTLGQHGKKIADKFAPKGVLNGRSYGALNEAKTTAPHLMVPSVARAIEEELHIGEDGDSVTDRVFRSLTRSGWIRNEASENNDLNLVEPHRKFSQSFGM
jgi:DNA topoisomerase IA